jgi:hypothetical protein
MNKSNFIQTGGYPLNAERLQEQETAYNIFNSLGALAGNLTIISGCDLTGTLVGNGFVYIDGEVIEFREADGAGTPNVIIIEEAVKRGFKNGIIKEVHTIRYATFGTAATSWAWSNFQRPMPTKFIQANFKAHLSIIENKEDKSVVAILVDRILALENRLAMIIPSGLIAIWGRPFSEIPVGWSEYTPLRGRMAVGVNVNDIDFNMVEKFSGAKTKQLSILEMPAHTHDFVKDTYERKADFSRNENVPRGTTKTDTTGSTGGGQAFSIMNPYRVVYYIQKT